MRQQRAGAPRAMVRIAAAAAWLGAAALAGSYLGALHNLGDSLAVFRAQIALGTLLAALASLGAWRAVLPGALAVLALAHLAAPRLAADDPGAVTVYQKNMHFLNGRWRALADEVLSQSPDVLFLQEVTEPNANVLEMVEPVLPHAARCGWEGVGGPALASAWPIVPGSLVCDRGLVAVRARAPFGEVTLVSLHLLWPFPFGQADHIDAILPTLEALERPVILGGDLNMVPWAHGPARIARAIGAEAVRPAVPSFDLAPLATLPIDHVFAASGTAERRPLIGSDHYGVLARVTP